MAFTKINAAGIGTTERVTVDGLTIINNLSVGGTVSIAGTLTYEDVTNIDAVGLITARNGIVVGSGITLSKDGDIFATGISTFEDGVRIVGGSNNLTVITSNNSVGIVSSTNNGANFHIFDNDTENKIRTIDGRLHISADDRDAIADSEIRFIVDGDMKGSISAGSSFSLSNDPNTFLGHPAADTLAVTTGGNERLRITSSGDVGIGTTNPSAKLETFQEGTRSAGYLFMARAGLDTGRRGYGLFPPASNSVDEPFAWNTGNAHSFEVDSIERLRINSSGNIGIGTTSPAHKLHITVGSANAIPLKLQRTYNNNCVVHYKNSSLNMYAGLAGEGLGWGVGTAPDLGDTAGNKLMITSSGDVGINGVIAPEADLHVHGNMLVEDTIGNNLTVRSTVNNGNDPNIIFQKARGGGTPAIVQNGDDIGNFQWRGYDGDSYETGASILCEVNGTPADGDMPMRMTLRTRSVGAASEQGRLRLDAAGDVSVMTGNLVISTAGKGIDFSAANNSHSGATASILDDYEEGTWTPAFKAANNSSNATTEVVSARYTKVGRKVSITAYIKLTAHATGTTGGIAYVYGLPFTNMNEYSGISVGYWANFAANQDFLGGTVQPSASHLVLRHTTGAASNTTNMDYDNNLQPNSAMIFSATYHTGE